MKPKPKWHYAEPGSWRDHANSVLAALWEQAAEESRAPTKQEIYDAYPYGMREYTPYKVWLEQVKWFQAGCPGRTAYQREYIVPKEQTRLSI